MKIPTQFSMGCHTWKVMIVSKEEMAVRSDSMDGTKSDAPYGLTNSDLCEISIRSDVCESLQWHSFWHEFMHVLTGSAGLPKLNNDEDRIDLLGLLMAQAQQTME